MEIREHYKTLELLPNASEADAKRAYRKLVNRWHPDRFARDEALRQLAEEHLKLFNIAYAEVKKHLATRPRRYRPRKVVVPRSSQTARVSPGFHRWQAPGSRGISHSGAVLNRLTRKFRQMLAAWVYAPQKPGRVRKRSEIPPTSGLSTSPGKAHGKPRATSGKNFDAVFNEVAGPEAARMKKAAARKKRGRLKKAAWRSTASDPIQPDLGKARDGKASRVPPVSRIKKVGGIRRI